MLHVRLGRIASGSATGSSSDGPSIVSGSDLDVMEYLSAQVRVPYQADVSFCSVWIQRWVAGREERLMT